MYTCDDVQSTSYLTWSATMLESDNMATDQDDNLDEDHICDWAKYNMNMLNQLTNFATGSTVP